ncbi:MAG: hypothetical protein DMG32_11355 [Acidobacteria bacterium]|nr:MAG: hypothetical protein DMG32_11355 [Acidobacteriota bacterium]
MARALSDSSAALAAVLIFSCALHAQYGAGTAVGGQRAQNNNNASTAPAPARDLQGVWMRRTPKGAFGSGATYTKDLPEMTPWGQEKFKEAKDSNGGAYTLDQTKNPVLTRCYPPGVPRVYFHPYPFEFVQTPKYLLMIFEYDHTVRRIYTDGRPLPKDPDPLWLGYSVGHWEGDATFVVDTVGFNEKTWLDRLGVPHSDQLHVTERFHRVDRDHTSWRCTKCSDYVENPAAHFPQHR